MKYLFIFAACMMLDAIVPAGCQSEEYRKHRFDNWTTDDTYTIDADSISADTTEDSTVTP